MIFYHYYEPVRNGLYEEKGATRVLDTPEEVLEDKMEELLVTDGGLEGDDGKCETLLHDDDSSHVE